MAPSKPKRDESRRSSILKPCKPRQPLQNVHFNSSSSENSPASPKIKRRVSFAEKKHVKEFCHSTEQGTVWDNTYEEHDFSLKGSFAAEQNAKASGDDCVKDMGIKTIEVCESDKDDLNLTNPVECMEIFSENLTHGQINLPNTSKNTVLNNVTGYIDKDKKDSASSINDACYPKMHVDEDNSKLEETCIQNQSMEFTTAIPTSIVPVYCDKENDIATDQDTNYSTKKMIKVASWKNRTETFDLASKENIYQSNDINDSITFTEKTKLLYKSMEITEAVIVPPCYERTIDNEHPAESSISNRNNTSMDITEAIPTSMKPIMPEIEVCRNAPLIVNNYEDTRCNTTSNSVILPNLQSNKSIVSRAVKDTDYSCLHSVQENSVRFTSVIQSTVTGDEALNINSNENDVNLNVSMEMTGVVPFKVYEKGITHSCDKTAVEEDNLKLNTEVTRNIDKTEFFNDIPMEMTRPVNMYERNIPNFNNTVTGKDLQKNSNDTEIFSDSPMQITRPINIVLPTSIYDKDNLRLDKPVFRDNRNMCSYNTSMEITKAVSPRNRKELFNPVIHEKNVRETKNTNNSIISNAERTKLLYKSMEITEAVSNSLLHERTRNNEKIVESMEALVSHNIASRTHLPRENSRGPPIQANSAVDNDETRDVSMEITAAVPSVHNVANVALNEIENLAVSKSNGSQCPTTYNVTEFKENKTRKSTTTSEETVEMTNQFNVSSNTSVIRSNFNQSLSATLMSANKKRSTHEDENKSLKKFCSDSLMESQISICQKLHSPSKTSENDVNNEFITEDTIDPAQISAPPCEPNVNDSINKSDEHSFLSRNLENSFVELESIKPPSFIDVCGEEENSFPEALQKHELHTFNITDTVSSSNKDPIPERLEPMNIEHNETKDCRVKTGNNWETDKQATERTSNDGNEDSVLHASNITRRKMRTLFGAKLVTEISMEDEENKEERSRREIEDVVELRNTEQKERCSEIREETGRCIDHPKETEVMVTNHRAGRDEYCQENSNRTNPQEMAQMEECAEERLDAKQDINEVEEEPVVEQDPFLSISKLLEEYAEKEDCIWNVYYKNVNRRMIVIGFMQNSFLIAIFLSDNLDNSEENLIQKIKIISRLADDADVLIKIVHGLILEKIDVATLTQSYRTYEDVLPMLDFVSQDVILTMNFMFELRRLDNFNLMEITRDEITFLVRSKKMDIVLNITVKVKRFETLTPNDVTIRCLLGTIRETNVKNLIKNVKKDHRFLSRFMNDVKDYIDIMEEISATSH